MCIMSEYPNDCDSLIHSGPVVLEAPWVKSILRPELSFLPVPRPSLDAVVLEGTTEAFEMLSPLVVFIG